MGSAKEEPSLTNAWISVLRYSVNCLSCVRELLNFQYALPHAQKYELSRLGPSSDLFLSLGHSN